MKVDLDSNLFKYLIIQKLLKSNTCKKCNLTFIYKIYVMYLVQLHLYIY